MKLLMEFFEWRRSKSKQRRCDFYKFGYPSLPRVGGTITLEMSLSRKRGVYELFDVEYYVDPHDMVKQASFEFIGYLGEKPIRDMNFQEFRAFRKEQLALHRTSKEAP